MSTDEDVEPPRQRISVLILVVRTCLFNLPVGLLICITAIIQIVLNSRVEYLAEYQYLIWLSFFVGIGVSIASAGVLFLLDLYFTYQVRQLEKEVDSVLNPTRSLTGIEVSYETLDNARFRVSRWARSGRLIPELRSAR